MTLGYVLLQISNFFLKVWYVAVVIYIIFMTVEMVYSHKPRYYEKVKVFDKYRKYFWGAYMITGLLFSVPGIIAHFMGYE